MNDTISRADALDAIEGLKWGKFRPDDETRSHDRSIDEALAAISALPARDASGEINALKDALAQAEGVIADLRAGIQA